MVGVRRAEDRGRFDHGWLDTRHTFAFGEYQDPRHVGFRTLKVMNEDRVQPGEGFRTHGHRDMEIVTIVLSGGLEHEDSEGNGSVIRPGDVQRMTAGRGIRHSEFNHSSSEIVHFYQVWILPEREGLEPGYAQATFPEDERRGRLRLVVSPDGDAGSVSIHQDASLFTGLLGAGDEVEHVLDAGRHAWVQLASGEVDLGDETLRAGDGAAVSEEASVRLRAREASEVLLFELG